MDCFIISALVGAAFGVGAYAVTSGKLEFGVATFAVAIGVYLLLSHLTGSDPTRGGVEGSGETVDDLELLRDVMGGLAVECGEMTGVCIVAGIVVGLVVADREKKGHP